MEALLGKLKQDFPALHFTAGDSFYWCPETSEVFYNASSSGKRKSLHDSWSLLHEVSHATLNHTSYKTDFELVRLEAAAWAAAKKLAKRYHINIDEEYIQDCIDTYRDWLYRRCLCPTCSTQSLQADSAEYYHCFNCQSSWRVTSSRFCRPYRRTHQLEPALVFQLQR
jgi:hypothetical protein